MPAILFGSISTIVDSSDLQREAFNEAFRRHGLEWHWDRETYQQLLLSNGGAQRIADEAARLGVEVDAVAVHRTKSERFRELLRDTSVTARPGVRDVVREALAAGWKLGFVTTTSPKNVAAIFECVPGDFTRENFDVITDVDSVENPKPAPDAYELAVRSLGMSPDECVAVEDNLGGSKAAVAAGIACVAFPNENTVGHDFGDVPVTHHLRFGELAGLISVDSK